MGLGDGRLEGSATDIAYCRSSEQRNDYQDQCNLTLRGLGSREQGV